MLDGRLLTGFITGTGAEVVLMLCPRLQRVSSYPALSLLRDVSANRRGGPNKSDSNSSTYVNRTKSAQSGGLETNGHREINLGLGVSDAVGRFVREALVYWASVPTRWPRRKFVSDALAEGEELGSNLLHIWQLTARPVPYDRDVRRIFAEGPLCLCSRTRTIHFEFA